ncbi:putative GPI-anchored protein 58 [Iris pallida]|uniref:GPI-anchored protein 58 n=1 Tax=Iris pallida TaxID=29817 RepID=A0AAX6FBF0_IRIPA|nr:putative GPI-anchored protein 58 [Iris pallida]
MQTEHHPHSSTRQHFHPPSLADDPLLGRPGRRPPPTAPPPSSPPIAATTTLTLRRPLAVVRRAAAPPRAWLRTVVPRRPGLGAWPRSSSTHRGRSSCVRSSRAHTRLSTVAADVRRRCRTRPPATPHWPHESPAILPGRAPSSPTRRIAYSCVLHDVPS